MLRVYTASEGAKWATGEELALREGRSLEAARAKVSISELNGMKLPTCKSFDVLAAWPNVDFNREIPIGTAWIWAEKDGQAWLKLDWEGRNGDGKTVDMHSLITKLSVERCLDPNKVFEITDKWKEDLWEKHRREFTRTLSRKLDGEMLKDEFFALVKDDFSSEGVRRLLPKFIENVRAAVAGDIEEQQEEPDESRVPQQHIMAVEQLSLFNL